MDRATDADRYLASDKLVWFDSPGEEPLELQLRGVPADQRFAAEVVGLRGRPGDLPRHLRRPPDGAVGARRRRCRPRRPGGRPDLGGRPPRPPPPRPADRDDAAPLRADPPRGRAPLGAPRQRARHLRPARLRAGVPGAEVELGRGTTFTAPHLEDEAGRHRDPAAHDHRRRRRPAAPARSTSTCCRASASAPSSGRGLLRELGHLTAEEKRDGEPPRILFAVRDGRDVGYAVFKRKHKWPNARPAAEVDVASSPEVRRRAWPWLDGWSTSTWPAPSRWTASPSRTRCSRGCRVRAASVTSIPTTASGCAWWTCPRRWPRAATRPTATWSSRSRTSPRRGTPVAGGSGSRTAPAEATRTDDDAEVALPVAALGAAYLGGANLAALHRAGVVAEHRPGADARAVARLPHRPGPVRRPRVLTG